MSRVRRQDSAARALPKYRRVAAQPADFSRGPPTSYSCPAASGDAGHTGAEEGSGALPSSRPVCYPSPAAHAMPESRRDAALLVRPAYEAFSAPFCSAPSVTGDAGHTEVEEGPGTLPAALDFGATYSFWDWAASLPRLLLASRTRFSSFFSHACSLQRAPPGLGGSPSTALFPLPVPFTGLFSKGSRGSNRAQNHLLLIRRVTFIVVLALDFVHSGGCYIPSDVLRRQPSPAQASALDRLELLVKACSRQAGQVPACPGRRGAQLVARTAELTAHLEKAGLGAGSYTAPVASGAFVQHDDGAGPPGLRPYRDADADRLKIAGGGRWDLASHLGPDLLMAYLEPLCLRTIPENRLSFPDTLSTPKEKVLPIFRLWSERGLLGVSRREPAARDLCRVFGAYKDQATDRMIGDRRGPNAQEGRLSGPSALLPPGYILTEISVDRYTHALRGSSTDRRDFYHQAKVSNERALHNAVGPPLPPGTLADLEPVCLDEPPAKGSREMFGDGFGRVPRGLLVPPSVPELGCFCSLFQGDHGGVEFATSGHQGLLQDAGLLHPEDRLLGGHPVPRQSPWQGLVIDDYFCISSEPVSASAPPLGECLLPEGARRQTRLCGGGHGGVGP